MVQFKTQTARNNKAIVKVCNAEKDYFAPQDALTRFNQRILKQSLIKRLRAYSKPLAIKGRYPCKRKA